MDLTMPSLQTPFLGRLSAEWITPLLARCSHSKIGSEDSLGPRPWASDSDPDAAVDANLSYLSNVIRSIIIPPGVLQGRSSCLLLCYTANSDYMRMTHRIISGESSESVNYRLETK